MGRYRIVGELGRGGMGVVYRAEDERLGRSVALKFLPAHLAGNEAAIERMRVEARAAAALDHPNVCAVYEVAETDDGCPYIAFACYDGETLRERLASGPLPMDEAVRIARGVAAGLAAAHRRGIVHRDLKPSNIFLCEDGTAKILDFGIAKLPGVALTEPGHTPGTVEYGAPETSRGRVDERSDVWSLGVVLYEMLTGRRPFHAPYEAAVLYAVLHEAPKPPSRINAAVPEELDAIVARCLAKDPDTRYPDASALATALAPPEAARTDDLGATLRRTGRAFARRLRQSRAWQVGAAGVLVGIGAYGVYGRSSPSCAWVEALPDEANLAVLPVAVSEGDIAASGVARNLAASLANGVQTLPASSRTYTVLDASDVSEQRVASPAEAKATLSADVVVVGRLESESGLYSLTLGLNTTDDVSQECRSQTISVPVANYGRLYRDAMDALAQMLGLGAGVSELAEIGGGTDRAQEFYALGESIIEDAEGSEDIASAARQFGRAIREDSTFALAYARLGQAYLAMYEATRDSSWVRRAWEAAEDAAALDSDIAEVHVTLSQLYHATGRNDRAMTHAIIALRKEPNSISGAFALADAREANEDVIGAEQTLTEVISRRPRLWTGPFRLGMLYYDQGDYLMAIDQFKQATLLASGNFKAHFRLGAAYQQADSLARARRSYERVMELRPDYYAVYSNLATMLLLNGQPTEALSTYQKALDYDSTNHVMWNNMASVYSDLGNERERVRSLRAAVRQARTMLGVNPNDAMALSALATYLEALGDEVGAREAARSASELAPSNGPIQYDLARVFALLGELEAATDALRAAQLAGHSLASIADDSAFQLILRRDPSLSPTL